MIILSLLPSDDGGGVDTPQEQEELPLFVSNLGEKEVTINNVTKTYVIYKIDRNYVTSNSLLSEYRYYLDDTRNNVNISYTSSSELTIENLSSWDYKNNTDYLNGYSTYKIQSSGYLYIGMLKE